MYITISFWVVYGVFLFLNLNQVFWGFSLKPYRKRSSSLTLMSYAFPLGVMISFGMILGAVLSLVGGSIPDLSKDPTTLALFFFWALLTVISFILLLIRQLKK